MKPKVITHQPASPATGLAAGPTPTTVSGTSRGAEPGVSSPEVPQPAVASRAPQATVIGRGAASGTPVAQQPGRAAPWAPPPSPTTVAPRPQAAAPATSPKAPPSVVPGTIRRGVDVSVHQLAQRFPGARPEALQQAERLLQDTVVDTLSAAQAARWGDEAQRHYGALVDASLQIVHSDTLQASLHHMARLHALLGAVAEKWQAPAKSSLFFWKSDAGPGQVLQASQGELAQLRLHLSQALPALRTLQAKLQAISGEIAPLALRLDALSLAAHYLADAMDAGPGADTDPRAHALVQRASALAQTVLHIHSGMVLRQGSQHHLDALIHRIQDTVLMALPAWMEKVTLATQTRPLNDTERYALAQQLQGLLGLLHIS